LSECDKQRENGAGWSAETEERITRLLGNYPDRQAALLPVLTAVQREKNWLSIATMDKVAERLGLSKRHVYGVATFLGGVQLLEHLEQKLGITPGQTTGDGKFTLTCVECLGSCGSGPVLQINDVYHENLTIAKVDEILEGLD